MFLKLSVRTFFSTPIPIQIKLYFSTFLFKPVFLDHTVIVNWEWMSVVCIYVCVHMYSGVYVSMCATGLTRGYITSEKSPLLRLCHWENSVIKELFFQRSSFLCFWKVMQPWPACALRKRSWLTPVEISTGMIINRYECMRVTRTPSARSKEWPLVGLYHHQLANRVQSHQRTCNSW